MSLIEFQPREPRPLPVFLLLDISGSMKGEKIECLNQSIASMLDSLREIQEDRVQVQICVITFGGTAKVVHGLCKVGEVVVPEFTATGKTPMGKAFELCSAQISNEQVVGKRSYKSTIVLVSDGLPTDLGVDTKSATREQFLEWDPLHKLHSAPQCKGCFRLALGIKADDSGLKMLDAFIDSPGVPVFKATDARGIGRFFQLVSQSITTRSVSVNPNIDAFDYVDDFLDKDLSV